MNPSIAGEACLFPKSGDSKFAGDYMISSMSSMTIEEGGTEVTLPRQFSKYSSQSFLGPIDIALLLVLDWAANGHNLAAMQSLLRTTSFSIQIIPRSARL